MRTRDVGWSFRHSSRITYLLEMCVYIESLHMHLGGK